MADFDDVVDPELIARLAAWFGEPAAAPEQPVRRQPDGDRLAQIEAVLDPELRSRLEAHGGRAQRMLHFAAESFEPVASPSIGILREAADPAADGELEPLEYLQPDDIRLALRDENTPQASLRDLFRPVTRFGPIVLRPLEASAPTPREDPRRVTREAMSEVVGGSLPPLPGSLIAADLQELREQLAKPWEDSKPAAPTRSSTVPDFDHYRWFGVEGAYDPDQ